MKRLYKAEWAEILKDAPVTWRFSELPVEELLVLEDMATTYPGLMFNLRKQRGKVYLLTVMRIRHPEEEEVKGEP